MNVYCAVPSMASYYDRWFKDVKVIGHESKVPTDIDLLIFTGGEDISPRRYREAVNGSMGVNLDRDDREFNILRAAINTNRNLHMLGVCRGLQLLNVYFGGTLVQDIDGEGKAHPGVHSITHITPNIFSWLTTVNSLHHQGIRQFGYDNGDVQILALEQNTSIPEIVKWGSNAIGVQFHPEMFAEGPGKQFFGLITDWVSGKGVINRPEKSAEEKKHDRYTSDLISRLEINRTLRRAVEAAQPRPDMDTGSRWFTTPTINETDSPEEV